MRYNTLLDRLQNLINYKPSQTELGKVIGIAQTAISGRANRNSNFNDEEIAQIEQHYKVNLYESCIDEPTITLDYYPEVFGSCGTGYFVPAEYKEQIKVPVNNFIKTISVQKKYSVINAKGDSMQPYIYSGDKLLVEHWEGEQIIDNQVYVFCYENEIFVKRLTKNINQLIIKSDNKEYDTIKLVGENLNKIIIIGQIVGLIREVK